MRRVLDRIGQLLRGPAVGDLPQPSSSDLRIRTGLTLLCGMLYGAAMGTFGGLSGDRPLQILISAVKVPLLLLVTFVISLPSFFVVNTLLGLRSDFAAVMRALAGGQAGLTIVLASLAPYTLLWYTSFANYTWALLFNGVMFAVATFAAQAILRSWYRPLIARNPCHRWLLRLWLIVYAFVGIQTAWVLRPFVGSPDMPVQFFREESWDNAYVIIGRMIWTTLTR
jgi:hypothetical protein